MTYHQRRWQGRVVAAIVGAVIAATVTALIIHRADTTAKHPAAPTITVTATPAVPPPPAPLPTADADRRTCNAWLAAGERIRDASHDLSVLPAGSTILDPQVRNDARLSRAATAAAEFSGLAGDTLNAGIPPGTTPMLSRSATAAAAALRALSIAYATLDLASGNAYHAVRESADVMDAVCSRLAPR
jgi:hypothetical protein